MAVAPQLQIPAQFLSLAYSQQLIRRASITPCDAGCQTWLAGKLEQLGFQCYLFQKNGVSNLIASLGNGGKTLAFAGHTDVVPPGASELWKSDPFAAATIDDQLFGRGAADMKTGLAAMLAATERFIDEVGAFKGRLMWLITSDEEGEAECGSKVIKQYLDEQQIDIEYCLVGEPTATLATGDTIKIGRRGALSAKLVVHGKQGHVAYPQYADNAVHKMGKIISALTAMKWDSGSDDFPGTSLQITHVDSGEFTDNIIPARCELCFNIRYSDRHDQQSLEPLILKQIQGVTSDFDIQWQRPCEPYITIQQQSDSLIHYAEQAIYKTTGKFPVLSTSGGTSDGRFFATPDTQVVELGVPNRSIHQINERVHLADLMALEDIYKELLHNIFG